MPKEELSILRVAVPSPLRRYFDYLLPNNHTIELFQPGMRLRVPFGRTNTIGILVDRVSHSEIDPNRLKPVITSLDYSPLLSKEILELMQWAAAYYHHPPGEVFLSALPTNLRKGKTPNLKGNKRWYLTQAGKSVHPESLNRAPRQAVLLAYLQEFSTGVGAEQLTQDIPHWQAGMKKLLEKEWVTMEETSELVRKDVIEVESRPILNAAQTEAITQVISTLDRFQPFLLEGVTGSGKTEVYLNIIEQVLQKGHQALVLVPEIGLTPQIVNRFKQRFNVPVAVLHSGLNDQERLRAWLMVKEGQAPILIGTRSAVFTPFQHLGIIIVDEEHDVSFKQQEGFRYSARDVAVMRARQVNVPIVLGTATPSLECVHNVVQGRYQHLRLPERAGEALHPRIHILDLRNKTMQDGLSEQLIHAMQQHLLNEGQVLLFLNRRGFAPTLFCHACGWISRCSRCDAHMTYHQFDNRQRCHHCGAESPVVHICPKCKHEGLVMLGYGTERIEQVLKQRFPEWGIVRIDRDSTRRKGAMDSMLDSVIQGKNQILIGTQMLAKGHHFQPTFVVTSGLDNSQALLKPGMEARAKIVGARRPIAYLIARPFVRWFQMRFWR